MGAVRKRSMSYVAVWVWLVTLLVAGLSVVAISLSKAIALFLIFTVAVVKAALVARHYMHLRAQPLMIYAIAGIPVLLAIGMILTLMPDIAFRP